MKRNEVFPSKWLKAEDVEENGGECPVVIKTVKFETLKDNDGNDEEKPVLYFQHVDKGLVLNKTNGDRLFDEWDDTDLWRGKSIILYTEKVTAFGKTAPAIRVRIPKKANGKGSLAQATPPVDEPPLTDPEGVQVSPSMDSTTTFF